MRLKRTRGFLKNPGVDSGLALGGVGGWGGGGVGEGVGWRGCREGGWKDKPSYAEVWASRVLASLSHVQLASLFLMFRRCCAPGFGSV